MKIQFALVHPDQVADPSDVTAIAGIVQTDQVIDDYTAVPFAFHPDGPDNIVIAQHATSENLLNRDVWKENIQTNSFHHLLAMPLWKGVSSSQPAGEVAFVKTNFPGTPEGQSTYVIFGLIKGDRQKLAAMAEKMFETTDDPIQPIGAWSFINTTNTGIKVEHLRGEQILDSLKQTLWGFGDKKYAMSSDISIEEFRGVQENTRHLIDHGANKPGVWQSHPDPEYINFLRGMDAAGLVPIPQWTDKEDQAIRDAASDKIMRAIIDGEVMAVAARRPRRIDEGNEPSL